MHIFGGLPPPPWGCVKIRISINPMLTFDAIPVVLSPILHHQVWIKSHIGHIPDIARCREYGLCLEYAQFFLSVFRTSNFDVWNMDCKK